MKPKIDEEEPREPTVHIMFKCTTCPAILLIEEKRLAGLGSRCRHCGSSMSQEWRFPRV